MRRAGPPILILLFSVSSGLAATEVKFASGGSLVVEQIEIHDGVARLTLSGGGLLSVDAALVRSFVEIPPPPASETPIQTPETFRADALNETAPHGAGSEAAPSAANDQRRPLQIDYPELIRSAAARYEIDAELLRRVLEVESGFDARAVSPKGAMGVAQLMPGTARDLGVSNPFDAAQSVDGAARLLKNLLAKNGGRFVPTLAAYNAGSGAVHRYGGVPPYRETIDYVERVLKLYGKD